MLHWEKIFDTFEIIYLALPLVELFDQRGTFKHEMPTQIILKGASKTLFQ